MSNWICCGDELPPFERDVLISYQDAFSVRHVAIKYLYGIHQHVVDFRSSNDDATKTDKRVIISPYSLFWQKLPELDYKLNKGD